MITPLWIILNVIIILVIGEVTFSDDCIKINSPRMFIFIIALDLIIIVGNYLINN